MKRYIQRKGDGYLETVDEFETMKEARIMLFEYKLSDPYAIYYISSRCCKDWKDDRETYFNGIEVSY
jgi:hypothetical protein